jgi:hypothetical protein
MFGQPNGDERVAFVVGRARSDRGIVEDDLDRCLDDTVIDVFEAIRLFLQVSSTAFVIAANRAIVQAAVERRYPAPSTITRSQRRSSWRHVSPR